MSDTQQTFEWLQELVDRRFWGFVTLKFEDGKVCHVKQEQNLKPGDLPTGRNRGNNDTNHNRQR